MRTRKKSMGPFTRARNAVIEELAAKLNIDARGCKERIVAESETYPESLHPSANMGGFETPCHDLYDLPEFRWMVPGALERIQCLDYLCVIIDTPDAEEADEWTKKFLALVPDVAPAPLVVTVRRAKAA